MKYKSERIKTLIIEEVMKIITLGEVKDPRIPRIMTISRITLSKDLHYCHLYFTTIGDKADINKAVNGLNSAAGFFQKIIGERLQLRFTPKIEFRYDEEEEKAFQLDKTLAQIENERREREQKETKDNSQNEEEE